MLYTTIRLTYIITLITFLTLCICSMMLETKRILETQGDPERMSVIRLFVLFGCAIFVIAVLGLMGLRVFGYGGIGYNRFLI